MSSKTTVITDLNLYELFDILPEATDDEIKKAYRKKALKYHPDKNPDDARAEKMFLQISEALSLLTDSSARANYDKLYRARKVSAERRRVMDSKRRKLRDDLEAREAAASSGSNLSEAELTARLAADIERIRKQSSSVLERERQRVAEQIKQERQAFQEKQALKDLPRLKVTWKLQESKYHVYTESHLRLIFSAWGDHSHIITNKKSDKLTALIEFKHVFYAAEQIAKDITNLDNVTAIKWVTLPSHHHIQTQHNNQSHLSSASSSDNDSDDELDEDAILAQMVAKQRSKDL